MTGVVCPDDLGVQRYTVSALLVGLLLDWDPAKCPLIRAGRKPRPPDALGTRLKCSEIHACNEETLTYFTSHEGLAPHSFLVHSTVGEVCVAQSATYSHFMHNLPWRIHIHKKSIKTSKGLAI